MRRLKKNWEDKEFMGVPMKNIYFMCAFMLVLIVIMILLLVFFNDFSYAKGNIELGYTYNSNTKNEKSCFSAEIEEKMNALELEIDTDFYKEQEREELKSLNIDSQVQANYYTTDNFFYYAGTKYNRNLEYGIEDKTFFDVGTGYKDYTFKFPLRVQAGISSGSIYYIDGDIEKNLFLTAKGSIGFTYDFLEFKDELGGMVNLRGFENTDLEFNNLASVKANLTREFFLSFSLNFSFMNDPPLGCPKSIRLWMARGGINF